MARIHLSGGVVLAGNQRVWLADDPGHEVDESRPYPGAPVVVGPADATRADVDRARAEARRLVDAGGPLVAAAGVDVGAGFRTARLEGGGEARRDAVLAAAELLGPEGVARIGTRDAVLVALFGTRATKRVGTAALDALAGPSRAALRLAVAASDLLGPEQVEQVLRLTAPDDVDPVPRETTALLAPQLSTLLGPYPARRRLLLVRSLWDEVVSWHASATARARARRRRFSADRREALLARVRQADDRWWRARAAALLGPRPTDAQMLTWLPGPDTWGAALRRALQEGLAATALVRTALAAEDRPVADAVLAHLDQLAYAATAHVADAGDRVASLHGTSPPAGVAAARAWNLASAVVLASEPGAVLPPDTTARLRAQLRHAPELAHAVLHSTLDLSRAMHAAPMVLGRPGEMVGWRRAAGYTLGRHPAGWWGVLAGEESLGHRLQGHPGDPAEVELVEDGLWLAELADSIAAWFGHDLAFIAMGGDAPVNVDPQFPADEGDLPSLESVPLAVAGAAQLVALGARPAPKPASWSELVAALASDAERLGLDQKLAVPGDVAAWNGRELPGTGLTFEVARTAHQLTLWGNYMGNCIASYAEDADRKFALVALRDSAGKLVVNVSVQRRGVRWGVQEALGRFNEPLSDDLDARIAAWAHELRVPGRGSDRQPIPAPPARRRAPGRGPRGRSAPAREILLRAAADLGDAIGEVEQDPGMGWTRQAIRPIAVQLGWAGEEADWLAPFVAVARLRRPGPLADAAGRALDAGLSLAELWEATTTRPLAGAVVGLGDHGPDLRRLADPVVPPSLRLALRDPRVAAARTVDLAAHRIRLAVSELLTAGDERLDRAAAGDPHTGFVTTAVLALTARTTGDGDGRFEWIPVSSTGGVHGRPQTSLGAAGGPWAAALRPAQELGVTPARLDEVLADAPGRYLLVPAAWTAPGGWPAYWARAHRVTREVVRAAGRSGDS